MTTHPVHASRWNAIPLTLKWAAVTAGITGVLWFPAQSDKNEESPAATKPSMVTQDLTPPLRKGFYQPAGKPTLLWGDLEKSFAVAGLGIGNCIKVVDGNADNSLARVVVQPQGRLGKARRGYIDRDSLAPATDCP